MFVVLDINRARVDVCPRVFGVTWVFIGGKVGHVLSWDLVITVYLSINISTNANTIISTSRLNGTGTLSKYGCS